MQLLGIDIGGSGIKGAPVDVDKGELAAAHIVIPTPQPSVPEAVGEVVAQVARHFDWHGPIGCTFPAVIVRGVAYSAANVDKSWIGTNGQELFRRKTGCPVRLINDADAAGIAEMEFGAGRGRKDVVILLTFGTGIGSAIFFNGQLLPNTEIGHIEIRGEDAEMRATAHVKERDHLSYEEWAERVNEYLAHLEKLFTPDLFILGGGISQDYQKFFGFLKTRAEVVPARFFNEAGMIGAAIAARALVEE
jgi:polyphosphate glucokinase